MDGGGDARKFIEFKAQPFFDENYVEQNGLNKKLEAEKWLVDNADDKNIALFYKTAFEDMDTNERLSLIHISAFRQRGL